MATFLLFDEVVNYIFKPSAITTGGPIDFDLDVFKIALGAAAPTGGQDGATVLANFTQIGTTGAYAAQTAASPTFAETGAGTGIWQFTTADIPFTASGGNFATFRYIVMYDDDTATPADIMIGFLDYGSNVDLTTGNTFTVNVGANGWFQITVPNS